MRTHLADDVTWKAIYTFEWIFIKLNIDIENDKGF